MRIGAAEHRRLVRRRVPCWILGLVGLFSVAALLLFVKLLEMFWEFLQAKFNELLPPESRSETLHHWLQVGVPVALGLALLLAFLYCCSRCCRGRKAKMMKAPGRDYTMVRDDFERSPRSYFRDLRGLV